MPRLTAQARDYCEMLQSVLDGLLRADDVTRTAATARFMRVATPDNIKPLGDLLVERAEYAQQPEAQRGAVLVLLKLGVFGVLTVCRLAFCAQAPTLRQTATDALIQRAPVFQRAEWMEVYLLLMRTKTQTTDPRTKETCTAILSAMLPPEYRDAVLGDESGRDAHT